MRYSGWISSSPGALPLRSFQPTRVTLAWIMDESASVSSMKDMTWGLRKSTNDLKQCWLGAATPSWEPLSLPSVTPRQTAGRSNDKADHWAPRLEVNDYGNSVDNNNKTPPRFRLVKPWDSRKCRRRRRQTHSVQSPATQTNMLWSYFSVCPSIKPVGPSFFQHWLTELEIFATIFAAAIHDYEHTGTTNNFHIQTRCFLQILQSNIISAIFQFKDTWFFCPLDLTFHFYTMITLFWRTTMSALSIVFYRIMMKWTYYQIFPRMTGGEKRKICFSLG